MNFKVAKQPAHVGMVPHNCTQCRLRLAMQPHLTLALDAPEIVPLFHVGALQLALRGTIFARMAPDQKTQLVEALQNME